ncbi:hypothetical protein C8R45DRAFT_1132994 [Mycena sanguinolenta]|nr:hypothetical protein C8R45DRAFT_1132994 [Mycena sanguinolenta]
MRVGDGHAVHARATAARWWTRLRSLEEIVVEGAACYIPDAPSLRHRQVALQRARARDAGAGSRTVHNACPPMVKLAQCVSSESDFLKANGSNQDSKISETSPFRYTASFSRAFCAAGPWGYIAIQEELSELTPPRIVCFPTFNSIKSLVSDTMSYRLDHVAPFRPRRCVLWPHFMCLSQSTVFHPLLARNTYPCIVNTPAPPSLGWRSLSSLPAILKRAARTLYVRLPHLCLDRVLIVATALCRRP